MSELHVEALPLDPGGRENPRHLRGNPLSAAPAKPKIEVGGSASEPGARHHGGYDVRGRRLIWVAVLVLGIAVIPTTSAWPGRFEGASDGTSSASALPNACDNFVEAAKLLAQHGSSAAVQVSGGDAFSSGSGARPHQLLATLFDACDAQFRAAPPR